MLKKRYVLMGLNMQLSELELSDIMSPGLGSVEDYERIDYMDFSPLKSGLNRALKREIDYEYFFDWAVLVLNVYGRAKTHIKKEKQITDEIAQWFEFVFAYENFDCLNDDILDEEPDFDGTVKKILAFLSEIEQNVNIQ